MILAEPWLAFYCEFFFDAFERRQKKELICFICMANIKSLALRINAIL